MKIKFAAFLILSGAFSVRAAGLVNGSFESPVLGAQAGYYTYATPPANFGWTIGFNTGVDVIHSSYWQPSSGQQSLDLSGFAPGLIYQDFSFPSAGTWTIKFDMSVNPQAGSTRSVSVAFGLASGSLTSLGTFTLSPAGRTFANMNWVSETTAAVTVDSASNYRLQFSASGGDASGPALDNVVLVQVPEPGTMTLGLLALGATLACRRAARD